MTTSTLNRALLRAAQNLTAEVMNANFPAIEQHITAALSELNMAHAGLARGNEPEMAKAIDAGMREVEAVLEMVRRRCN